MNKVLILFAVVAVAVLQGYIWGLVLPHPWSVVFSFFGGLLIGTYSANKWLW